MPLWASIGMGLLGLFQQHQQGQQLARAERMMQEGGLSPEELAELERRGEASMKTDLSRRGMLSSGLLPGARAALTGELALAKARARAPFQQSYLNYLLGQSQRPSLLGQLVPLFLQYGIQRPGGGWLLNPAKVQP